LHRITEKPMNYEKCNIFLSIVESFYSVKYGSSIIMSDNLVNENINWYFQRNVISKIVHFGILIHVLTWNIDSRLLRKKTWTENQQLFDRIIDVTLFDGVEGLD